jgi:hypothetical protein
MLKIDEETYKKMKDLVFEYEKLSKNKSSKPKKEEPYIRATVVSVEEQRKYNPNFGDNKICKCGHRYYRHFDSYEEMYACGCKYCQCYDFKEKK